MSEALMHETQNQQPPRTDIAVVPDARKNGENNDRILRFPEEVTDGQLAIKMANVVTDIQTDFQSVQSTDKEIRHTEFLKHEAEGVYKIFRAVDLVDDTEEALRSTVATYHEISNNIHKIDREIIYELSEKYADHPALVGVDMLKLVARDNLVHMRRAMLIMIDSNTQE